MTKYPLSPNVEILCIGTELLLGQILNSNARWLAFQLASVGLPHYRQSVIGDNSLRLEEAVLEISKRSAILITTGGLGPTPDDLTTQAIANAFNTSLEERPGIWDNIKQKTNSLINRKQAFFPKDALTITNNTGTAPGMIWNPIEDFTIITLPGVPSEMKEMWENFVIPWMKEKKLLKEKFISHNMYFAGISESELSQKLNDLFESKNPTIAPYATLGEVQLRLTAQSTDNINAQELINPLIDKIKERTDLFCYGENKDSLASTIIDLLRQRGETLCVAESCTGGGLGAALAAIPGASDVFLGGFITYSNSIKENLVGVSAALLQKHGAVSTQVVEAMATGSRNKFQANWSIAISGLAGPTGESQNKPIGLVHFGLDSPFGCTSSSKLFSPRHGRTGIQKLSVIQGLNELRLYILARA